MSQICILYASELDHKEIYSLFLLKFKAFYEWQPHWWSWGWWIFVNVSLECLEGLLLTEERIFLPNPTLEQSFNQLELLDEEKIGEKLWSPCWNLWDLWYFDFAAVITLIHHRSLLQFWYGITGLLLQWCCYTYWYYGFFLILILSLLSFYLRRQIGGEWFDFMCCSVAATLWCYLVLSWFKLCCCHALIHQSSVVHKSHFLRLF